MTDVHHVRGAALDTIQRLNCVDIEEMGRMVTNAKRVFTVGNGGSAAHASHCACDLIRLAHKHAICLNDCLASYSAGINDDGDEVFSRMLARWDFDGHDLLILFSVGGCSVEKMVSLDILHAAKYAHMYGRTCAVVGRLGDVCKVADHIVHIDCPVPELITPVVESVMPLVWHALVAGPLKREEPVWR